ncbi:MAG TPA: phosphatase PAP2 family protein [Rhizomicrobium sp.]|nr:phosphatase PAP2 family protein [Rhizomicrobium sp.]
MTEFRLKLAFTLLLIAIDAAWIALRGFSFDMKSLAECVGVTAVMAVIGFVYTRLRPDEKLATLSIETGFLMIASAAGSVFSYLVTTLDMPLVDDLLVRVDDAVAFNWYHYIAFVNARPWLGNLSSFVYQTTLFQIAFAVVLLTMTGRVERTRELTAIVMVSSFLCVAVSGLLPSEGALAYYHPSASFYMQNNPVVDLAYKQTFFDLRHGVLTHLSLVDVHGLVAFPSYHVGLSVILMIAFRGIWKIFWPVVALNTLVILSTPIDGGHHLSDGLGGIALALLSAAIVVSLRKRLPRPATETTPEDNYGDLAGQKA